MTKELVKAENKEFVQEKYDKIIKALENLKVSKDTEFKTSGQLRWNPNSQFVGVHIDNTMAIADLITAHSYLKTKDDDYNASAKMLGIKEYPPFKWQGHTFDEWEHDIKVRLSVLTYNKKKNILENAKHALEPFLTQDQKFEQIIATLKDLDLD